MYFLGKALLSMWNCGVYPTTYKYTLRTGTSPTLFSLTLHLVGICSGIWLIIYYRPLTQYVSL